MREQKKFRIAAASSGDGTLVCGGGTAIPADRARAEGVQLARGTTANFRSPALCPLEIRAKATDACRDSEENESAFRERVDGPDMEMDKTSFHISPSRAIFAESFPLWKKISGTAGSAACRGPAQRSKASA